MLAIVLIQFDNLIKFYFFFFIICFPCSVFHFCTFALFVFWICVSLLSLLLAHLLVKLHVNNYMLN